MGILILALAIPLLSYFSNYFLQFLSVDAPKYQKKYEDKEIKSVTINHNFYGHIILIKYKNKNKYCLYREGKRYIIYYNMNKQLIVVCNKEIINVINEDELSIPFNYNDEDLFQLNEDPFQLIEEYIHLIYDTPFFIRNELKKKIKTKKEEVF